MTTIDISGSASIDACFAGDRSVECSVPSLVPSSADLFAQAIHLWRDGFDTADIAAACNITEAHAYHIINEYFAKKYSVGWGHKA